MSSAAGDLTSGGLPGGRTGLRSGTTRSIPHDDIDAVTPQVWDEILGLNVADACVLLADSTYTTGEVLVVDGGLNLVM